MKQQNEILSLAWQDLDCYVKHSPRKDPLFDMLRYMVSDRDGTVSFAENVNPYIYDILYCFGIELSQTHIKIGMVPHLVTDHTVEQRITAGQVFAGSIEYAFSGPPGLDGIYPGNDTPAQRLWYDILCLQDSDDAADENGTDLQAMFELLLAWIHDCPVCNHDGDGPNDYPAYRLCTTHKAERTKP